MGTFHHDTHELHGMTVVVETRDGPIYVGRCDTVREDGVVLVAADRFEPTSGGPTREEYLATAARYGVHERLAHVLVPAATVTSVRRLADVATSAG